MDSKNITQQLEKVAQLLLVTTTELSETKIQHNQAFNQWMKTREIGSKVPDNIRILEVKEQILQHQFDAQLEIVHAYRVILEAQTIEAKCS